MSKAKLLGRVNTPPDRGNKQRLRWEKQNAKKFIKKYDPGFLSICMGEKELNGCLREAVAAGMKRKGRK